MWLSLGVERKKGKLQVKKGSGILIFHCRELGNWLTDDSRSRAICILFKVINVTTEKIKICAVVKGM